MCYASLLLVLHMGAFVIVVIVCSCAIDLSSCYACVNIIMFVINSIVYVNSSIIIIIIIIMCVCVLLLLQEVGVLSLASGGMIIVLFDCLLLYV